jgi:hypothetical protein
VYSKYVNTCHMKCIFFFIQNKCWKMCLISISSGSHILALLWKHWWLNCSTFALQSSELWIKFTVFKVLPMSSDLSYSDLLSPFLKARHIWTITMVTTKSKLQMEYNKEVTSASSGLVNVSFGSCVKCSRVWAIAGKNLI